MRVLPLLALAALTVTRMIAAEPAAARPTGAFPYPSTQHVLPNGLKVIFVPMESNGLVSYYSVVRTGSRDEIEPGKSGFAHFFEHMMFRGTKRFPKSEYDAITTRIGTSANAYTSADLTVYHLKFAREDLPQVIEIESDRFQNLSYSEPDFQTEAGAVYGEYRKNITSPFVLIHEKIHDVAFDRHTYKHTTMGFERDIKTMPQQFQYSLSFFKRFYRPENVVILVTGDFDPAGTLKLIEQAYGGWAKGYAAPAIEPEPPQQGERTAEISYPGKTLPILTIGYKGDAFAPANKDFAAAMLIEDLAFGETSPLRKKLLIQEQKVQTLGASFPLSRDQPLFQISAMVKQPGDLDYVRDEIYRTLEALKTTPVDGTQLRDLKRHNKYSFIMGLDSAEAVAATLARFIALTGGLASVDQLYAALDAVTPEDIQRAAKKYFPPERRTVVVLKGGQS